MNTSPSPSAQPEFIAARHAALDAAGMAELKAANINPRTGLATDYLNHFNEAVMLLEMIPDIPECAEDFLQWRPLSYAEHFTASILPRATLRSLPTKPPMLAFAPNS